MTDERKTLGRQFHVDILAIFVGNLEEILVLKVHHARQENIGHLLNAGVVGINVVVEELAAVGDFFFQLGDALLQLHEIIVGLQVGIIFRNRKKAFQRA